MHRHASVSRTCARFVQVLVVAAMLAGLPGLALAQDWSGSSASSSGTAGADSSGFSDGDGGGGAFGGALSGSFIQPIVGFGAGTGGVPFQFDNGPSVDSEIDSYSVLAGLQVGAVFGVPIADYIFFTPRVALNFGSFGYSQRTDRPDEKNDVSFTSLRIGFGLRAYSALSDGLWLLMGGGVGVATNFSNTNEFTDAGDPTNNETEEYEFDLGFGGFGEFGIGYEVSPGMLLHLLINFEGYSMPISRYVRKNDTGTVTRDTTFETGAFQEVNNVREHQTPLFQGAWNFVVGVNIQF